MTPATMSTEPAMINNVTVRIGVLALQGAFIEHIHILNRISLPNTSIQTFQIKTPQQLLEANLDGLIIPGGESTTMALIAERNGLLQPLREWIKTASRPVWGTCAGMILLSNQAHQTKMGGQALLGGLDVVVKRNAFGAQVDSFQAMLNVPALSSTSNDQPFPGIFIRAPVIESADLSLGVEVLCKLESRDVDNIVAVRQGHILGTAFHPELTNDDRFHRFFLGMVLEGKKVVMA
ncbi:hypothetical protein HK102_006731 [Quaeritorhiza haematococci]|nr:hypothetical protein HK102_006731 [Quaeritorhiza haematococci]